MRHCVFVEDAMSTMLHGMSRSGVRLVVWDDWGARHYLADPLQDRKSKTALTGRLGPATSCRRTAAR